MKNSILYFVFALMVFATACSSEKKSHEAHEGHQAAADHQNKGFDDVPQLAASVIQSLANYDYNEYYSHVITKSQEKAAAATIQDNANRKAFMKEFEFSIKEEKVYFDNIEKLIKEEKLDMANARVNEMEILDYKATEYAPQVLKQVIIPVMKGEMEIDIVFVVIQLDGKWYLTAELGV
jgi:hypothetical protein